MKVLHLGNTAGVANMIDKGLRFYSVESTIVMWKNPYNYPFTVKMRDNYEGFTRAMWDLQKIVRLGRQHDIIHQHSGMGNIRWLWILKKVFKKPLVVHFHGGETRNQENIHHFDLIDQKIVATPDLLDYFDDAVYIPNAINIRSYNWFDFNDVFRIVHFKKSHDVGTSIIQEAIQQLQKDFNINFEIYQNVSHNRAIAVMNNSHIVIDEMCKDIGFYGMVSLEAMSMGKIPVCYINPKYTGNIPVVSPKDVTVDSLVKCLTELLQHRDILGLKSNDCYNYVKNNLNCEIIAEQYLDIYRRLVS